MAVQLEPSLRSLSSKEEDLFPGDELSLEQKEESLTRKMKEFWRKGFHSWRKCWEVEESHELWIPPLI